MTLRAVPGAYKKILQQILDCCKLSSSMPCLLSMVAAVDWHGIVARSAGQSRWPSLPLSIDRASVLRSRCSFPRPILHCGEAATARARDHRERAGGQSPQERSDAARHLRHPPDRARPAGGRDKPGRRRKAKPKRANEPPPPGAEHRTGATARGAGGRPSGGGGGEPRPDKPTAAGRPPRSRDARAQGGGASRQGGGEFSAEGSRSGLSSGLSSGPEENFFFNHLTLNDKWSTISSEVILWTANAYRFAYLRNWRKKSMSKPNESG